LVKSVIQRAYRYRFYPTEEQKILLDRVFGCCRFVFNHFLNEKQKAWKDEAKSLSYGECSERLRSLKKELPWLKEVSSVPLQQSLRHLDKAYKGFFNKIAQFPKFKKKHAQQSATYMKNAFTYRNGEIHLAKDGAPLDIRWSRGFAGSPSSLTITKDSAGRYFVSILVEEKSYPLPPLEKSVGVDLGLINTIITSDGFKEQPGKFLKKKLKALRRKQKTFSRRVKKSKNWQKAKKAVARLHAKVKDTRTDCLHKISKKLIDENQVITFETLDVKKLMQNRALAFSIADASWGTLVGFVKYKALWYGREFIQVDKYFPSSKKCFPCGAINYGLTLNDRTWQCPSCKRVLDRDLNSGACLNEEGLKLSKTLPWGTRDIKPVEMV